MGKEDGSVKLDASQLKDIKGSINGVRGAVGKVSEAIAPVEDKESISAKLGAFMDLVRGKEMNVKVTLDLGPLITALIGEDIDDKRCLSGNIAKTLSLGFAAVVAEIAKLTTPSPPAPDEGGMLMARYKFDEDQEPVTFDLIFRGGKSAKGTAVGAGDIDLSVASSSAQLTAELGPQTLSDDGNEVKAAITLTGQAMSIQELAVVSYAATNRDTGNQVAADVDEFETGPGEVAIGELDSPVPLPEV